MLAINHNLSAANVANTLTGHYKQLQTSTQRLSSGLRINGAADDAAGLAIRELMRSDITALRQGMRNVNDAISMVQTFDGALSVIDEKLIRMKELAEQAATGTYDSTQRLLIDSEFQAMGEEINRIARATDFNGIKLIDGEFEPQSTQVTGPDGKTYDISAPKGTTVSIWPGATANQQGDWNLNIADPGALLGTTSVSITNNNIPKIGDNFLLVTPTNSTTNIPPGSTVDIQFDYLGMLGNRVVGDWYVGINGATPTVATGNERGFMWTDPNGGTTHIQTTLVDADGNPTSMTGGGAATWTAPTAIPSFTTSKGAITSTLSSDGKTLDISIDFGNGNTASSSWNLTYGTNVYEPSTVLASATLAFEIKDVTPKDDAEEEYKIPDDVIRIHFGTENDSAEDYYDVRKHDATLKGLGLEGVDIQTQDRAQNALVQINDAIVVKDGIRAEYGAMQNRMENTLTNITVQAENLEAAESRISDAEVAQEMMNFVRQQILTQSAVAMLAQANSMPQMVMSLIR